MPSAATSDGSQSELSAPGMLNDEALGRDRHVDAERVHRDVVRRELVRGRHREVLERGLGHAVRHQAREVVERGDRRDVQDRALAAFLHAGEHRDASRRSGARRSTCITRSKRFIARSRSPGNVIAALLTRMSTRPNASIVVVDHRVDLVVVSEVGRHRDRVAAGVGDRAHGRRRSCPGSEAARRRSRAAAHATLHPRCGERDRGRGADAAARAGDDRDLAVEFHGDEHSRPLRVAIPGDGRWPSARVGGGSTAGACAAPRRRVSRPSSPRCRGRGRSPCTCSRVRCAAAPPARGAVSRSRSGSAAGGATPANASRTNPASRGENTASPSATRPIASRSSAGEIVLVT